MSLRTLWNSICGKPASSVNEGAVTEQAGQAPTAQTPVSRAPAQSKTSKSSVSREDKKLFRRIESLAVGSLLDISVGNGIRSLAMLQSLTHKGHSTPLQYIAIDEFEMGGNSLTLREFHKQLREYPAKAQLVPMSIDAGLDRVVRTYGQVDLIIWGNPQAPTGPQLQALLRLSKPGTVMFSADNGRWSETLCSVLTASRAA